MTTWAPQISEVLGAFPSASNATLLARTASSNMVIYKPDQGIRPLWDFDPATLNAREVLTAQIDAVLGFDLVPESVIADGPYGPGLIQRFVEADPGFDPVDAVQRCEPELWTVAVLDLVCNNADRKAGHILSEMGGSLRAIDHGLTFHPEDKLRTTLWCFAGERMPPELVTRLHILADRLDNGLAAQVGAELGLEEADALVARVGALVASPLHPQPPRDRPPVPWPPV